MYLVGNQRAINKICEEKLEVGPKRSKEKRTIKNITRFPVD